MANESYIYLSSDICINLERNLNIGSILKTNFIVCSIESNYDPYEHPYSISGLQASKDFANDSDTVFRNSVKRKLSYYKHKLLSRESGINDREGNKRFR